MADVPIHERFPEVYHYTTMQGLEGILSSNSLHATHIAYLNGRKETKALEPSLKSHLRLVTSDVYDRLEKDRPDFIEKINSKFGNKVDAIEYETQTLVNNFYKVTYDHYSDNAVALDPFVISFCAHENNYEKKNGLLSQWRAYGKEVGAAIVFDSKKLWDLMLIEAEEFIYEPIMFSEIEYANENFTLEGAYPDPVEALNICIPQLIILQEANLSPMFMPFLRASCTLKHQGFSEENEVRIILAPLSQKLFDGHKNDSKAWLKENEHKSIKTIRKKTGIVPYIDVFESLKPKLPIKKIIIGPGRNNEMWLSRVLRQVRGMEIDVYCSETPLN